MLVEREKNYGYLWWIYPKNQTMKIYLYKSIANDIKDIKKMLDTYKETFKSIVKEEMEEHIKIYHNKER